MDDIEAGLKELILAELIERPKYYPYAPYRGGFRGAQGIYLTKLSLGLTKAFCELVQLAPPAGSADKAAFEFAEGERSRRESSFFRRNPWLRQAAIERLGLRCVACKLEFRETYGPAGEGYIEIHHLNPLAERSDAATGKPKMTSVVDVVPLCANCHRVVHRQQPVMSIAKLESSLDLAKHRKEVI
jgi:hypothetical protein